MSLNPVYTIGNQVAECFNLDHVKHNRIRQNAIEVLRSVKIPAVEERLNCYPFQFSGGMRQRTSAAIAIARSPRLLIADEPTTALDVTIQDQFLTLLKEIQQKTKMGIIMVTHDLAVVAEICDRIAVMYGGKIVETGTVKRVYQDPAHPYTRALMMALPKFGSRSRKTYQIDGEPPNPANLPPGCSFHPRCPNVMNICRLEYPPATDVAGDGYASCWLLNKREN
jgi:oligopeptide/dipeptide ABC transporter ATP-binding protein